MQSHYIASSLVGRSVQSNDFIVRGLKNLSTGRLESFHSIGLPRAAQPAYPEYVANLPAFLKATATQARVTCGQDYELRIDPSLLVPLALPPLALAPPRPFKDEAEKQEFLAKFGDYEVLQTIRNKKEVFVVTRPETTSLLTFPPTDPAVQSTPDTVNVRSMVQVLVTLKVITLFLATHTYPAFQHENDDNGAENLFANDMDLYSPERYLASLGHRGRKMFYSAAGKRKWTEKKAPMLEGDEPLADNYSSMEGNVFVAKPAPLYPMVNYGPANQVPHLPGFVFPYFHGMFYPTKDVLINVMRRYFSQCFGTFDNKSSNWKQWLRGVDTFYRTKTGMVLSHIMYCIQTTLECQGRLFVVMNGSEYIGAAIIGFRFDLMVDGQLHMANSAVNVRLLASQLDKHSEALEAIINILKALKVSGEDDVSMDDFPEVTCARQLHTEINRREEAEGQAMVDLRQNLQQLSFSERYWPMTGDRVRDAIDLLVCEDKEINERAPMYIDPQTPYDSSRFYKVLSLFGPTAPSFIDASGSTVSIPRGPAAADPESVIPEGSTSIKRPVIFVTGKRTNIAVGDMKNVFRKRTIRQNENERAGGFRTIGFRGISRDMIWNALKSIPFVEGPVKGKRGIDEVDEPEVEGGRKKNRKDRAVNEEFTFSADF